jgi:hypothetical protein
MKKNRVKTSRATVSLMRKNIDSLTLKTGVISIFKGTVQRDFSTLIFSRMNSTQAPFSVSEGFLN